MQLSVITWLNVHGPYAAPTSPHIIYIILLRVWVHWSIRTTASWHQSFPDPFHLQFCRGSEDLGTRL